MFNSRTHSFTRALIAGGLLSLVVGVADTQAAPSAVTVVQQAQPTTPQAQPTTPQAQPAPEAQPTPDSELAAKIRKAIADDKALAPYALTLKVVVNDGLVALKGLVKSEADKKAIGEKADKIAGEKNVMNNLVIAAAN